MITVRKTGTIYRADTVLVGERMRLSLGTRHEDAAHRLANRIARAISEGAESPLWKELEPALPKYTFDRFAASVGYQAKPETPKPKWAELVAAFEADLDQRIATNRIAETTVTRYKRTHADFGTYLSEHRLSLLEDIKKAVVEGFKVWRLARIKEKKFSRGGGGLRLDSAILHQIFSFAVENEMIVKNPVRLDGRPGENPHRGAQPYSTEDLAKLREHAAGDLAAYLLLRWTGLRGSDAVRLGLPEVDFNRKEIEITPRKTQRRGKKVIIPIHTELLFALEAERDRRKPGDPDRVLLNPGTGKPLTRPRLYERMLALGRRAGVPNAHPHRFRDTFAVDLLLRGASPYDVAKLLGDTIETVEKHYTPFVRELRDRVRSIMETGIGLEELAKKASEQAKNASEDLETGPKKPN